MIRRAWMPAAGCLVLLALRAPAQDPAPAAPDQKPPVFAREVEQVNVDVVVADKQGNPVTGLKQEDFTILEEGQPETIVSFDVVELPATPGGTGSPSVAPRPRLVDNASASAPRGRLFTIVFDNLHLSPLNAQRAKAAVAAFLEKGVREGDRVSLVATGGGAWWSTRMEAGRGDLIAILKTLDGRRFPGNAQERLTDFEAMRIFVYHDAQVGRRVQERFQRYGTQSRQGMEQSRQQQTNVVPGIIDAYVESRASEAYLALKARMGVSLAALERVLAPLAEGRDRKAVLFVSEGFVYDSSQEAFSRVTEAARRANAALYFIDTRGLEGLSGYSAQFGAPLEERDMMSALADMGQEGEGTAALATDTGGFSVRSTNDFASGLVRIGRESRAYYVLGYNPGEIPRDGRFRKITVRVRGKGLTVRARRGYYAPADGAKAPPARAVTDDSDLQKALDAPGFREGIPLRMTSYVLQESSLGKARVLVAADADVSQLAFQEVEGKSTGVLDTLVVVAHRESGEFHRNDQKVDLQKRAGATASGPSWYSMVREFDLAPGGYQARLVVRDPASRRIGSVALDFEVPPLDQLRVSTPILTDSVQQPPGQAVPVPVLLARRTFVAGGSLYCRFDVFGMAREKTRGMPRVRSGHVLRRIDGTVISRGQPTWIEPTSLGALARMLQIPLDGASAGDYELVLTVEDQVAGQTREIVEPFRLTSS
jgi:VWFA-related protein